MKIFSVEKNVHKKNEKKKHVPPYYINSAISINIYIYIYI